MSILSRALLAFKTIAYCIIAMLIPFVLAALGMAILFNGTPPSPFDFVQAALMFVVIIAAIYLAPKFFKAYEKPSFPHFDHKKLLPYIAAMLVLWGITIFIATYYPHLITKFPLEAKTWVERGLLIVIVVILAPIAEELLFRDFLLKNFTLAFGKYAAIIITALMFATMHGLSPAKLAITFSFGLLFALARLNLGSLQASLKLHVLNNIIAVGFLAASWF